MPADDPTHPSAAQQTEIRWQSRHQVAATTWRASDRFVPRRLVRPLHHFVTASAGSAAVILAATLAALIVANTGLASWYDHIFGAHIALNIAGFTAFDLTVQGVINDGLMVIFFLLVSLEIKRELVFGQLRDPRAALLPIGAAIGGMAVPALIYAAFNASGPYSHGWGIPVATDIAFAIALLAALGDRVPAGARLFLLALAIVDDLGAIMVIAIFYAAQIHLWWLAVAAVAVIFAVIAQRRRIRAMPWYIILGVICWYALLQSGVHPTLAGVAFGLITPAHALLDVRRFPQIASRVLTDFERRAATTPSFSSQEISDYALYELRRLSRETQSPLHRIEVRLAQVVAFGIVPLFAFANAGIAIPWAGFADLVVDPVVVGIIAGLVVGKTVGVCGVSYLLVALKWAKLPENVSLRHMIGLGMCAGIGFTVAIFVANLAFTDPAVVESAKLGVLLASAVAAILGYGWLRTGTSPARKNTSRV